MFWNEIYTFFVKYIFGGFYWDGGSQVSYGYLSVNGNVRKYTLDTFVTFNGVEITFGNYLSLLATIICVIIILVLCCLFIGKMVKTVAHLFDRL